MSETVLKAEERVAFALRALYKKYGYLPYKMSKFEAYDFYVSNKDFLRDDGVITFNDTDGKLLALKPDVTLSIIKNGKDEDGKQKVFYHENVYRISGESKQFKELGQIGLECIGKNSAYDIYETAFLAAASLNEISQNFVLDISHLGILSGVLEEIGKGETFKAEAATYLAQKNLHDLNALCKRCGVEEKQAEKLMAIVSAYGEPKAVLKTLAPYCQEGETAKAFEELSTLCSLLDGCAFKDKIRLDFSVVNDMKYYNGVVFKGFVDGVSESVLSGGQYDGLTLRMGRKAGAIGFAVYLDLISLVQTQKNAFDVGVLVLYDKNTPAEKVAKTMNELTAAGKSARAQTEEGKLRFQEIVDLRGGEK